MELKLTKKEVKELKYQCRMGYILPSMIFVIGTVLSMMFLWKIIEGDIKIIFYVVFGLLVISALISYIMNRKYYADIKINKKTSVAKVIQKKVETKDFEAGSGNMTTLPHNNPMNEFMRYDLIVENTKFRVDKELFESCSEGDEVLFLYAPKSKFLLGIEKK